MSSSPSPRSFSSLSTAVWKSLRTICRKSADSSVIRVLLDLLYPPVCRLCTEQTRHLLCPLCLSLLGPADPALRCRHCFAPVGDDSRICRPCKHSSELGAPHAFLFEASPLSHRLKKLLLKDAEEPLLLMSASFFILQAHRLGWEAIDRIALIPDRRANRSLRDLLDLLAEMTKWPLSKEFRLEWQKPFVWKPVRRRSELLENQTLLLLDWSSSKEILQACLSELWPAFPKQVYILSLFEEEEMG